MSASWRTRWRRASSAAWRSIASASTFAEAWTKWTSWGVKRLGSVGVDVEDAEGAVLALDHDGKAAADAEHAQGRRHRVALLAVDQSSTITCRPDSIAAPAWESRAAETRLPSAPATRRRARPAGGGGGRRGRSPRRRPLSTPSVFGQQRRPPPPSGRRGRRPRAPARRAGRPSPAGRRPACSSCSAILRSVMS